MLLFFVTESKLDIDGPNIQNEIQYLSSNRLVSRVSLLIKQMLSHGRNLGLFALIYKFICSVLRKVGITGGIESWIAGFVGGFYAFGDSRGISGSVNNQIVLYLFAR